MLATPAACREGPPYIGNIEGSLEGIGRSRHMPSDQTYVERVSVFPKNTFGLYREQVCNFPPTQEHEARASVFTFTTRRLALGRCISDLVSIVSQILQGLHCDCVSVKRRHRFHVHEHLHDTFLFDPIVQHLIIERFGMHLRVNRILGLSYRALKLRSPSTPTTTTASVSIHQRHFHNSTLTMSPVKRKAEKAVTPPKAKRAKLVVPEYHLTPSQQDDSGEIIWPARKAQIERARKIIREWYIL